MLGVGEAGATCSKMASVHKARAVYVAVSGHGNTPIAYSEITNTPVSFKHFYEYFNGNFTVIL